MLDIESAFYDASEADPCVEKAVDGPTMPEESVPVVGQTSNMEIESHQAVHDNSPSHTANNSKSKHKLHVFFHNTRTLKLCRTDDKICCFCVILTVVLAGVISFVSIFLIYHFQEQYIHVALPQGTLKGKIVASPQGDEVEEYLGIPFAVPPVGDLRYADPLPLAEFPQDVYEAFDYKNSCIQYLDTTFGDFPGSDMWNAKNPLSEDCLYMNIWMPRKKDADNLRSVMVWIYGGGFYGGSNSLWVYDGKALAAHGDVIVVSFNYRVGSFGFLSTGDGRIKGNFGIKDQVLALQWIHDHITLFGGDPKKVTIFAESSGASSAGLHMMSDYSSHLFNRAIFESGSPDANWAFMTKAQAKERATSFLNNVNCTQSSSTDLLKCLRNLDSDIIYNNEWVTSHFLEFPWAPTVDGDFLTDTPYNLLKAGKFSKDKETLLGVNKDEGTFWILYTLPGLSKDGPSYQNYTMFKNAVNILAWDLTKEQRDNLTALYSKYEIKDNSSLTRNRDALDKICGDRSFTCPTLQLTSIFTENSLKTYFYYLTYRSSTEVWPPWMGVIHGAEIQWVFGMPMNNSRSYTAEEKQFAETIMSYWSNFAKSGDPNGPGLPQWPQYTTKNNGEYVQLHGPSKITVESSLRPQFCVFWDKINADIHAVNNKL